MQGSPCRERGISPARIPNRIAAGAAQRSQSWETAPALTRHPAPRTLPREPRTMPHGRCTMTLERQRVPYTDMRDFIRLLDEKGLVHHVTAEVDPVFELGASHRSLAGAAGPGHHLRKREGLPGQADGREPALHHRAGRAGVRHRAGRGEDSRSCGRRDGPPPAVRPSGLRAVQGGHRQRRRRRPRFHPHARLARARRRAVPRDNGGRRDPRPGHRPPEHRPLPRHDQGQADAQPLRRHSRTRVLDRAGRWRPHPEQRGGGTPHADRHRHGHGPAGDARGGQPRPAQQRGTGRLDGV